MRSKRQGRPAGQKKGAKIQAQHGGGSKGSTGGKGKKKRPIQDDDDDEEIDEDLAFNEEDEKRYGELLREIAENDERKRKRPGDYNSEDDMDDDDDGGDDDDGEGMLLSDLLGGSNKKAPETKGKQQSKRAEEEEGEEEEESGEEDEDDESDDEEDEEGEMDVDHAGLLQMVEGLANKGKPGDAAGLMAMELQNMPDSAFGTGLTQGLTMEAMLDSLKDTRGIAALRQQLVTLSQSGKAVSAPAPTIVQERAERQVVYGEKRKAVGEWLPLVSSARQADTLNFSYEPRQVASQAELVGKFEPESEMELAIRDLLTHAKADKEAKVEQSEAEALAARGFTVEQVKARQAELASMRALLFYEQQKRHRINKIKSKAYHRIRKRQRLRKEEGEQAALREADPEAAAALDEKDAIARVTERMSLKHKNTSKWAKHVLQHGAAHQADTRKAIAEQLHMGEELRRRAGALPESGSEEEESESESDSDEDEGQRAARLRKKAAGRIRGVLGEEGEEEGKAKGILGMKFMQRAAEKQRERAREEMDAVLKELEQDDGEGSESEGEGEGQGKAKRREEGEEKGGEVAMSGLQTAALAWGGQGTKVRVSGPISVTGGSSNGQAEADGVEVEVAQEQGAGKGKGVAAIETVSSGVLSSFRAAKPSAASGSAAAAGNGTAGGWSTSAAGGGGKKPAQVAAAAEAVSNPWLDAPVASRAETRKQLKVVSSIGKKKGKGGPTSTAVLSTEEAVAAMEWDEEDGEEEGEEGGQDRDREQGDGKGARVLIANTAEQKALVKRAFGAPDLEEDFAQDKAEQLQKEREEEAKKRNSGKKNAAKEAVMGWGCWAGPGAAAPLSQPTVDKKTTKGRGGQRPPPKHEQRALQPVKPQAPAAIDGEMVKPRVDDKLPTVLINERRIKQASKFKLGEVPYPFTSREQYERSLRLPVGKEWNTTISVREATRAPVIVKPGTIVEPIKLRKKHRAVFGEAPTDNKP